MTEPWLFYAGTPASADSLLRYQSTGVEPQRHRDPEVFFVPLCLCGSKRKAGQETGPPWITRNSLPLEEQQRAVAAADDHGGLAAGVDCDRGAGVAEHEDAGLRRQHRGEATLAVTLQEHADATVEAAGGGLRAEIVADAQQVELAITIEVARHDRVDRSHLRRARERGELEGAVLLLQEHAAREFGGREFRHRGELVGGEDVGDRGGGEGLVGREFLGQPRV